jgi:hypothetical protein
MADKIGAALLAVALLILVGYSYQRYTDWRNRREALSELHSIERAWQDLEVRSKQISRATARKPKIVEADLIKVNEETAVLRRKFLAVEHKLQTANNGVLPQWVKDDRTWQHLDRTFRWRGWHDDEVGDFTPVSHLLA